MSGTLVASVLRRNERVVVQTLTDILSVPIHAVAFRYNPRERTLAMHSDQVTPPATLLQNVSDDECKKCFTFLGRMLQDDRTSVTSSLWVWKDEATGLSFSSTGFD